MASCSTCRLQVTTRDPGPPGSLHLQRGRAGRRRDRVARRDRALRSGRRGRARQGRHRRQRSRPRCSRHARPRLAGADAFSSAATSRGRRATTSSSMRRRRGAGHDRRCSRPARSARATPTPKPCASRAAAPRFGADMDADTIPLEAGLEERAISRSKGCYVGQEVIVRVQDRGHGRVAKRLVGLTFDAGAAVPAAGARIVSGERGDRPRDQRDMVARAGSSDRPRLRPPRLRRARRPRVAVDRRSATRQSSLPLVPLAVSV